LVVNAQSEGGDDDACDSEQSDEEAHKEIVEAEAG
jgi:hypothetical protein